jgi:hypothetical protein
MSSIHRYRPVSSRRTRLLAAALLWCAVGTGLGLVGLRWLWAAGRPGWIAWGLAAAVVVGWAKGRFLLGPRAEVNARRIVAGEDERCLGAVFPWSNWALVLVMIAGGMLLRRSPLPRVWLGSIYVAVGIALWAGSLPSWRHWWRLAQGNSPQG